MPAAPESKACHPPPMSHSRPLSGMERAWLTAAQLFEPFAIAMVVDYAGAPPGEPVLSGALDALTAARPDVRLRLHGAAAWAHWKADGPPPVLALHDTPALATTGALDLRALQAAAPLDPLGGATLALHVLPLPEGSGWRLVLRGCHALLDGRGLLAVLDDLISSLRGEALAPVPLGQVDHAVAKRLLATASPSQGQLPAEGAAPPGAWASPFGPPPAPPPPRYHHPQQVGKAPA